MRVSMGPHKETISTIFYWLKQVKISPYDRLYVSLFIITVTDTKLLLSNYQFLYDLDEAFL